MDFDIGHWLELAKHYPIVMVVVLGWIGGTSITQAVKKSFLASGVVVSDRRYQVSVMWLSILMTGLATNSVWLYWGLDTNMGLRHVLSAVAGFSSPYVYKMAKALVAWKFPEFAAKWGDG